MDNNATIIDHDSQMQVSDLSQNVAKLAIRLDYSGSLSIGALEDEIRFYQARSIEACLALGTRLLILKEITPHGDFIQRVELLGFSERMAQKFMSAAFKFSNPNSTSVLKAAGNQTKLLELLTFDDSDISELSEGGTVAGLNLDDIEKMSVRELKKALRDARADNEAKGEVIANKESKISELDTQLARRRAPDQAALVAQEAQQQALLIMQTASNELVSAVAKFNADMNAALEISETAYVADQYQANVNLAYQQIAEQSYTLGVQVNFETMVHPDWVASDAAEAN